MKNRCLIESVICVLFLMFPGVNSSYAQYKDFGWIHSGTGLAYSVNTEGADYQYIIVINGLYPELSFRWDMTFPIRTNGTVKISQEAMDTATTQRNKFSVFGSDLLLEDETSVWISRKVYQALKAKMPVLINCGDNDEVGELLFFKANTNYKTQLNDLVVLLPALYAETGKGNKYWILDDPDNPIILKMTIEFNIQLDNIMTEEYLGRE
jgi:hypothetical protein